MSATSDAMQLKLASEPTNPAVLLSSKVNAGFSANCHHNIYNET